VRRAAKCRARLVAAVQRDQTALAAKLLREGAECNARDDRSRTLLRIAVENGSLEMAELLLTAQKLNVSWEASGRELIAIAAKKPHVQLLKLLMQHWIAYAEKVVESLWPHHPCSIFAALETSNLWQLVLIHSSDRSLINARIATGPNIEDGAEGWTMPLHLAVLKGDRIIAASLMALGADIRSVDSMGLFAHEVAMEHGSVEMLTLLRAFDRTSIVEKSESRWQKKRNSDVAFARTTRFFHSGFMVFVGTAVVIGATCIAITILRQRDVRRFVFNARVEPIQFYILDGDGTASAPMASPAEFNGDATREVWYQVCMEWERGAPDGYYTASSTWYDMEGQPFIRNSPILSSRESAPNERWFSDGASAAELGGWPKGSYTVIVNAYGHELARGTFRIK